MSNRAIPDAARIGRKAGNARRILIGALVVALVSAASASVAATRERLAGDIILLAARPAVTEVELPTDIEITNPRFGRSDFKIDSSARFAGFALVSHATGETWLGGRIKQGRSQTYFFVAIDLLSGSTEGNARTYSLPRGIYDIVIFSDSHQPVKVELHLDELSGSSRVRATQPASTQVKFPSVHNVDPDRNVHWIETTGRIPSRAGLQFAATWFNTSAHAATSSESCFYKGGVPEPDRSAPACFASNAADMHDNNTALQLSTYPNVAVERGVQFVSAGRIYTGGEGWTPGTFSQALSVRTSAVQGKVSAIAIWLGL